MTRDGASEATGNVPDDHDPLSVLRGSDLPVTPDPEFAARLRSRLESALALPNRTEGVVMSGTDTVIAELNEPTSTEVVPTVPRSAALPYLTVVNARDAIDWYVDALGATLVGDPFVMDDGRIGHAGARGAIVGYRRHECDDSGTRLQWFYDGRNRPAGRQPAHRQRQPLWRIDRRTCAGGERPRDRRAASGGSVRARSCR